MTARKSARAGEKRPSEARKRGRQRPLAESEGSPTRRASVRERNRMRIHNDIYESAMSLFIERGYEDVTVDEIVEESGISKATFFRYFESKYGLVDEFNQRIAAKIEEAIDLDAMLAADCIRAATDTMFDEWLHSAPQMRNLALEFVRSGTQISKHLADPMTRNLVATLILIIEAGQRDGEFIQDVEARLVAPMIVYAWTIATVNWFDDADEEGFNRSIHRLVEVQIRGMLVN